MSPPGSGPTADDWSGESNSSRGTGSSGPPGDFGGGPFRFPDDQVRSTNFPGQPSGTPFAPHPSVRAAQPEGFGDQQDEHGVIGANDEPATGNRPPIWMLIVGLVIPLATLPLLWGSGPVVHLTGWLIAIAGSLGFLTAFTVVDLKRRARGSYADKPALLATLRIAVAVTGIVVAALQIYPFADAIARSDFWA